MHRIDHATATVDNLFTEGDPVGGIAATVMTDDWANAVQEEICEVVETAGLTLNKADNTQLYDALVALGLRAASESQTGVVELANNTEVQAGTDTERAVTAAGIASFAKSTRGTNGYAKLPGGMIIQWGDNEAISTGNNITFPIAFPNACLKVLTADNGPLYYHGTTNYSTTGFTFWSNYTSLEVAHWLAIGY